MRELKESEEKRVLEFCFSSDLEFYEKHLADLTLEEQAAFMNEFPGFLSEKVIEEAE